MLRVNDISSGYGEVTVLHNLYFDVQHEIYAILGANGAGKSTLMKTISRLLPLKTGQIYFKDEELTHLQPHQVAARGIAYVPQEGHIFPDLSVAENLSVGSLMLKNLSKYERKQKIEEIYEVFPALADRASQKAGSLSGGEAQMVAVGRALMQDPALILLDEPTTGLSPKYVDMFFDKIKEIHKTKDVSVILSEQNAEKAMEIADKIMVLTLGKIHMIDDCVCVNIEDVKEGYRI
jgi:branched-chain amino acid transport system ATP-binding protein